MVVGGDLSGCDLFSGSGGLVQAGFRPSDLPAQARGSPITCLGCSSGHTSGYLKNAKLRSHLI